MATKLRRATLADAATIRNLTRLAYAKWVPLIGREPKPMTVNYDKAVVDHVIDLYEENTLPVALIKVVPQASCLMIENIAVLPNQQGKGIGDLLLNHAETIARSLHLAELRLVHKCGVHLEYRILRAPRISGISSRTLPCWRRYRSHEKDD